jgi:hypothetical protein
MLLVARTLSERQPERWLNTWVMSLMMLANFIWRPLDEPAPLTNPNQVAEFKPWKMACRNYEKLSEARCRNSSRVYALIISQCLQVLHNCMEASEEWNCINEESNVMDLLQLIQKYMMQRQTRQKPVHTLMDAEAQVFTF